MRRVVIAPFLPPRDDLGPLVVPRASHAIDRRTSAVSLAFVSPFVLRPRFAVRESLGTFVLAFGLLAAVALFGEAGA